MFSDVKISLLHTKYFRFFSFVKTDPAQWLAITSPEEEDGKSEEKESAGIRGLEHGTSWVEVHIHKYDIMLLFPETNKFCGLWVNIAQEMKKNKLVSN